MSTKARSQGKRSQSEESRTREEYWRQLFRAQEASGLNQSEFCRSKSISANAYFWWKREIKLRDSKRAEEKKASRRGFARRARF